MTNSSIIDNRSRLMVDVVNDLLERTDTARFAVGYFYLKGFDLISEGLSQVKEVHLLIGRQTDLPTIHELSEGYERLVETLSKLESDGKKKELIRETTRVTKCSIKKQFEIMPQTDENEIMAEALADLIESGKLKVRIYTKETLHSKAYLFAYKDDQVHLGEAVVGSSNISPPGFSSNTELNAFIQGDNDFKALTEWFKELWNEAEDFREDLMFEIIHSWTSGGERRRREALEEKKPELITPYDIYLKTAYELVKDRLEEKETVWRSNEVMEEHLTEFQQRAVKQAINWISEHGGCFVSDVVGIGKSYIGSAIIKHYEITKGWTTLIICPKSIEDMWLKYKSRFNLKADILPMSLLTKGREDWVLERYGHCQFVIVDESHNFRNLDTERYKVLEYFLAMGKPCCLITATPRNNFASDIKNQIKLFHQEDSFDSLDINPPSLNAFFKEVEDGNKELKELLRHLLIRRTRKDILKWYGYDDELDVLVQESPYELSDYLDGTRKAYIRIGKGRQYFPVRKLETIEYSIERTYQGFYDTLMSYLGKPRDGSAPNERDGKLRYVRYGLWDYIKEDKREENKDLYRDLKKTGVQLRGLMRVLLLKRLESSVEAFRCTIRRLRKKYEMFLLYLDEGIVLAGLEAQDLLKLQDEEEEVVITADQLVQARAKCGKYIPDDFDLASLREDMENEITMFDEILELVDDITPEGDAKFQRLAGLLSRTELKGKKIIFTESQDTARYLYKNLDVSVPHLEICTGQTENRISVVNRFAPKANEYELKPDEEEIESVIATDVLSEGLNLQDCDKIINYDLHWNPVRLIQRLGRIDRIGSEQPNVYGYNFLPETEMEKNLGLHEKIRRRIRELHATVGEDSAILDPSERVNQDSPYVVDEKAMEEIYNGKVPDEKQDLFQDLNDIEEMMRKLKEDRPEEFERIQNLRGGIRSCRASDNKGIFVFLESGKAKGTWLVDDNGDVVTRDKLDCLNTIECSPEEEGYDLPSDYNKMVEAARSSFQDEMDRRYSKKDYSTRLTQGQSYVLEELRIYGSEARDEELRDQIDVLSEAFSSLGLVSITKELNQIKKETLARKELFDRLVRMYQHYGMEDLMQARNEQQEAKHKKPLCRIVCGERLV